MKTSTIVGIALGAVGLAIGGVYAYKRYYQHPDDRDASTLNPWRGTGTACERDFDAKSADERKTIVALFNRLTGDARKAFAACEPQNYI